MGILSNTVSICQFQVVGAQPQSDLAGWVRERLAKNGFRSIEQSSEELSIGWVELADFQSGEFADESSFAHDHYFTFSLRRDQRKLPATLVKPYIQKAEADWLAQHPKFRRVPKAQREDLREAVKSSLFAKTLPTPALFDAVWDTRNNLVTLTSLAGMAVDLFIEQFKKSFDGLRLVPYHPMARAAKVIGDDQQQALAAANQAGNDTILEQIEANQWLGSDYLLWLMHETMHGAGDYAIDQDGPAVTGEGFVAYLNDRLLLAATGEQGMQKVTVTGPQDRFTEVRTALHDGKQILESVLYLEKQEQQWKLTLKGANFHFASFKAPPVTLERDDTTDPDMERQAVFFERMHLLETGLQLFDSLLSAFLKVRLGKEWPQAESAMRKALAE